MSAGTGRRFVGRMAATLMLAGATQASADYALFEEFSYTGEITRVSDGEVTTVPGARDGSLFIDTETGSFSFLTNWYAVDPFFFNLDDLPVADGGLWEPGDPFLTPEGAGNPNNVNEGLVQIVDPDGSSVDALSAEWSAGFTEYTISVSGSDALGGPGNDMARLWTAPSGDAPFGDFLSYELEFTATYAASQGPLPIFTNDFLDDVSGFFSGVFAFGGDEYLADFVFQPGAWSEYDEMTMLGGIVLDPLKGPRYTISYVETPADVPAPAPFALLAIAMGALAFRRQRSATA